MTRYGMLLGDIAKHAAKDGDPDAAGDEDERPRGVVGQQELPLGRLDVDLGAHLQFGQRSLEGAVTHSRGEAEHALLVRRRHDADMPAKALLVLVADVGQRDKEVLPRLELDLLVLEVRRSRTVSPSRPPASP